MQYNKILKIWVIDLVDYFLISVLISSVIAVQLKNYYSEKASREQLKNHMNKDYGKQKHHQLLKYSEDLRKQGKFIEKESRESYLKLLTYSAMVSNQLNWDIKDQYLKIF